MVHASQKIMCLSDKQAEELVRRIDQLVNEYAETNHPDGRTFGITILFNPNDHLKPEQTRMESGQLIQLPTIDHNDFHILWRPLQHIS